MEPDELSTLASARFEPSPVPTASFVLTVVEGPDVGARVVMSDDQPSRLLIGTSSSCALCLTDREVSRRHAALEWVDGRLRLLDLGSRNGTRVDAVAVVDAYVEGGEHVRIGASTLRVERAARGQVALAEETSFGRLLGASREMRRLYPLCRRLADTNVSVLVEGETGTGKEVLAEALHEEGPRAKGPFVVFDCTTVAPTLLESELFGHERGAFTGATATRRGVFELASGGTLLIDEIGDLDRSLQPKLLRAVERQEIRRVGGAEVIRVDVRVLSATRRDLDREVQAGRFRDDLYHRLAVARIELPPLRRRRGDVAVLAMHFASQMGFGDRAIDPSVLARWSEMGWPGNVRELRNAVARHMALGDMGGSASELLEGDVAGGLDTLLDGLFAQNIPLIPARKAIVEAFERRYVAWVLERHGGNVVRAAEASGIARRYFQLIRARGR